MAYLKIENNNIVEAPKNLITNEYKIYGYNQKTNQKMLLRDGYTQYPKSKYNYEIVNGEIVEKQITPVENTIFSKLEIRRACRQLNLEDKLNTVLNYNDEIKSDWNDAQCIDLNDEMFETAVSLGVFSENQINEIKEYCNAITL